MNEKLDYKKEYKDLYMPKQKPMLIDVPKMSFIAVSDVGAPGSDAYTNAMQVLYALSFTIKMSKMSDLKPEGYFEYVVPPLESLWWSKDGALNINSPREQWLWTSLIRQPEFVTEAFFYIALKECMRKKPEIDFSKAQFITFTEGLCVQIMHVGSYADEPRSIALMEEFIKENHLKNVTSNIRKHHEIYLSDPRKTAADKLKTVIRLPVEKL